jgi:uncharacterized protein
MKKIKRVFIWIVGFIILYIAICLVIYFVQESIIFDPKKLPPDYQFQFEGNFEEINIKTADGIKLNGILVKADSSKGVILFLHGSGGNIERYKKSAPIYTELNYDIFLLDYRGYGKSEGKIKSEKQFFEDIDATYSYLKSKYKEENMVIIGFSIGTVPAAMIASKNKPRLLILEAPHFSFLEKAENKFPILPVSIIMKYKFETYKYIIDTKMPIAIFHGTKDKANDYSNSLRLKQYLKHGDHVTILDGEDHYDFASNNQYIKEVSELLK